MSNVWILGPCSIENEEVYFAAANKLYPKMNGKNWFLKGSFDKANRTSIKGGRGPGLEESIRLFKKVKEEFPGIRLLTDVHEVWQVEKLAPYIDAIQIPAFLCRQTDLIVECAKHFDYINIKKGQWIGPNNVIKSVDKVRDTNPDAEVWLTERGSMYGYDHLIVDFTVVDKYQEVYDHMIMDCTHSVQRSRQSHGLQGDRLLAKRYMMTAYAMGYSGIFAETHPNPPAAVSDGDCQIHLDEIGGMIDVANDCGELADKAGLANATYHA